MRIRAFTPHDLAPLTELTIATFRPFYEDSFRPLVGRGRLRRPTRELA
ncbi:hypothetical protein AB0399_16635 [Streptomyces sp. NPDC088194]